MTTKSTGYFSRSFIKLSLIIIIIFTLAVGVSYAWLLYNSKRLLINLVNEKSAGKLKLQLAEATFNFSDNEVKIREGKITSTNKNDASINYDVTFKRILLHTNSIWSLLANQSLEIREIKVFDPTIDVYNHLKNNIDSARQLSLGVELGKLYNSIQDGISALHTHSIYIDNAKLILNNKEADKKPIVFSNIYFSLTKPDKFNSRRGQYLENNNLDFSSSNQDIMLSDRIHKLSFKKLSIKNARSIILDSCTIIASANHAAGNNYTISFKKLVLAGVDFNALYQKNIIKADSVYCESPVSNINLNSTLSDSNIVNQETADIEKIIKAFSGNLDLGYVGVMNADIHLDIKDKRRLSNFHSGKVNFQITNLRINPDSSKLISIHNFEMMVKGYQLYNSDSTSVFTFDSIRFSNDKLFLNNFTVHTISGKNKIRDYRDYTIPYFELLGINWSELIFRQNLQANEAILHDPVINFIKNKKVEISKRSLFFNSHQSLDDFMDIEKLKIINGTININWDNNNSFQLTGLNLDAVGNNIANYKRVSLNNDIQSLSFTNGFLKTGDINAQLKNVVFNANDQLLADELLIQNTKGEFDSKINNVSIDKITSGKDNGSFIVDGLKWDKGIIKINSIATTKKKYKPSSILLQNINGRQTLLQTTKNKKSVSAFIDSIQINYFLKNNAQPFIMKGLLVKGKKLNLSNDSLHIKAEDFNLSDDMQEFKEVHVEQNNHSENLIIATPSIQLDGAINNYFSENFHIRNLVIQSPQINYNKENILGTYTKTTHKILPITIDLIDIHEPVLNAKNTTSDKSFSFLYSKGSELKIKDFKVDSNKITASDLNLKSGKAYIANGEKKFFEIDSSVDASLQKIKLSISQNKLKWEALVTQLSLKNSNGFTFNLKKENTIRLKDIHIKNGYVNSDLLNNPVKLIAANPSVIMHTSSVNYTTKKSSWNIQNISYNGSRKEVEIDSVNYHPLVSRDSVIASSPYQMDYIYYSSGRSVFSGFDPVKLFDNNVLSIQKAMFTHPSINVYRDKLPPFLSGIRKKLFAEAIKNIDLPVSINSLIINDGRVSYQERNARSRLVGNVILTHLNGNVFNIKNYHLDPLDTLSISLKGDLMDKELFNLDLHQSYNDRLYGFVMNLQMEPTSLSILNPLLAPLSDVKFISGHLDNFKMNVIGNENVAHGKMKFYYHDIHIKLLKNGGTEKTRLLKSTESNLVNFLFVRNNNTSRTGLIYFKRIKDRSFYNYIVKIIFSGIGTSVGAHKNKNYRKQYKENDISSFGD